MFKYYRAVDRCRNAFTPDRVNKPIVKVFYGDSGSGKTYMASNEAGPKAYYWTAANGDWFDGYTGQREVVFEEFYGNIKWNIFLKLLDTGTCLVPYKGGFAKFVAERIWITSNRPPSTWYKFEDPNNRYMEPKALFRRLDYIDWYQGDYKDGTVKITNEKNELCEENMQG